MGNIGREGEGEQEMCMGDFCAAKSANVIGEE
jgi:hypothetical protein